MPSVNLPVACSLTGPELQERRSRLLRKVSTAVLETTELENGFAYRFPSEANLIVELAEVMTLERQCCPFMQFNLKLEPGQGPIWLELTGPEGTKDFLNSLFTFEE
jgi:hypothetical protein